MTSSAPAKTSRAANGGIRPILLFFIVAPILVACIETFLQYSVTPDSDLMSSLAFATMFTVPGTFFAWLTTTLLARLPGARKLPVSLLLVIGFVTSLLVFRPYNLLVYDWISRAAAPATQLSQSESDNASQAVARFLFVNIPGALIWTGLNLLFMMRFGFPVYGSSTETIESERTAASPAPPNHDASRLPDFCRTAGIDDLGNLWAISAEEHYLKLRGSFGTRMIRHSFGGAIDQMPKECGLRIHRSHWISFGRVARIDTENGMQLVLADGTKIPVSSSYWNAVRLTESSLLSA